MSLFKAWIPLLLVAVLAAPIHAQKPNDGKKDDKEAMKEEDKPAAKEKTPHYRTVGQISGRISQISEGGSTFTLRVTGVMPTWVRTFDVRFGRWRVNPNYNQPNVITNDIDVIVSEHCKVRIPAKREYDEKGRLKPAPKKDPKEDPDHRLPGYKGELSDLAKDQMVTVTFGVLADPKAMDVVATHVFVQQESQNFKRDY